MMTDRDIIRGVTCAVEEVIDERYIDYDVKGAGNIRISKSADSSCGGVDGFSIGVEWGKFGYVGGVISRDEAIRMAKHILRVTNLDQLTDK